MKKYIIPLVTIVLLYSCAQKIKQVSAADLPKKVDYKLALTNYLKSNYKSLDEQVNHKIVALDTLYDELSYDLVWFNDSVKLTQNAQQLIDSLSVANQYGLNPDYYNTKKLVQLSEELAKIDNVDGKYEKASQLELELTNSYLLFAKHLNHGVLDSISSITEIPRKAFKTDLRAFFKDAVESDSLMPKLFAMQPKHHSYNKLQKRLAYYVKNSSLSTKNIEVENFRKDSVKAVKNAKKALLLHKYLDSTNNDSIYVLALKRFQVDHGLKPDGLVGTNTAKALSRSPYDNYQSLVASLERWRWKDDLPSDYLFANIPSYELYMYEKGKFKFKHKTVVGKKKTQTPELVDTLLHVIAYPYWNVPRKIATNEILAKAKRDSTYLKRNNFELISGGKSVDINSIDWSTMNKRQFNYRVRQGGGNSNALGLVKFIFPNKNAIYFHDTPSKSLFHREKRAFSHGCVRVHDALSFADKLLEYDNNDENIDSVKASIKRKKQKLIKLNNKIPVYIDYFTAVVNENDELVFYDDIYNKDRLLLKKIKAFDKQFVKKAKS